jgi:hypothetical protein
MRDPLAAKFEKTLDPWQRSARKFDFEPEFVKWIQKYLEKLECISELVMAKSWINGANFNEKRHDDCTLQWEAFQESIASRPALKAVVANPSELCGVGDSAHESVDHRADHASVTSPSPSLEGGGQDLPDQFKRLDGESAQDYRARMARIVSESIKKVGSWS